MYLVIEKISGLGSSCGGSLIHKDWIITAGHCIENAAYVTAHLGSLRAGDKLEPGRKIIEIHPENIHKHPKLSLFPFANK